MFAWTHIGERRFDWRAFRLQNKILLLLFLPFNHQNVNSKCNNDVQEWGASVHVRTLNSSRFIEGCRNDGFCGQTRKLASQQLHLQVHGIFGLLPIMSSEARNKFKHLNQLSRDNLKKNSLTPELVQHHHKASSFWKQTSWFTWRSHCRQKLQLWLKKGS